ncbi:DUF3120 domain-containing protein [Cronbergia sp. UHCC 0137]|uniref:DUF3120 domain-containing protein n=1 Tax=Cronbergia sp. UHCC 0137 TaxID=3110239 RepID=UPI002B1F6A9C|nr:DUF3120 domain-containing protein [Cronbergia sp. UHCC 0137]MEA5620030.1 DUF3120 domain-containing protein [Cronbergia sp. UHCC 0137]
MINHTFPANILDKNSLNTELQSSNQEQKGILESSLYLSLPLQSKISAPQTWLVFIAAMFLVSVPVFIEAPLVRSLPTLSLAITGFWVWLSITLMSRPHTHLWGDLLQGFSWSWLAGSIYWGWLRWEPAWHLPIESIGLPYALWCLTRNWGKVGNWFYLGSLFGTVLTDIYFYLADLMPYWRQIMNADTVGASQILQNALTQVQTTWGQVWAITLALVLMIVGVLSLVNKQRHWYAFGGAVLSTILVDSLFLLAAIVAH